ncbi:hypothetical protein PFDSM3638_03505 [Pyrococcus furiosus DSM 3638]|uniref:DsrE family protein n=3 Tax=Pyrococcus furiosus TaxID=2261 RepID=A0A5C0XQ93_PYRFU|nr:hypothetical protein [Pyrococcus furiosus]AAL80830.1 hypothetical protein PF0706 [Pyrococcus furiosus DSM 3638]AFN03497.1 hypothetical protein PFC_02675 [Pyrococcus furiosus COM1]QEK78398.1 hypothetical protein PFDSM3638_03505 [Pyrococcus furiosus DSM 3638]
MVKVLVIISSDNESALPGFMWAVNAIKHRWVEDVEVILFGPIERAIANGDERFLPWIEKLKELGKFPIACKRIAELEGFEVSLQRYAKIEYVGKIIAKYLEKDYVPMTF